MSLGMRRRVSPPECHDCGKAIPWYGGLCRECEHKRAEHLEEWREGVKDDEEFQRWQEHHHARTLDL